jgi:hypothetical protein
MEVGMTVRGVFISAVTMITSAFTLPSVGAPISYSFVTVDYPSAYSTQVAGVNAGGVLVGLYDATPSSFANGFSDSGGVFNSISAPAATLGTVTNGINSSGKIVGQYGTGTIFAASSHGFLDDSGALTTLDAPSAGSLGTVAYGINNAGTVVGLYMDGSGFQHGFLESSGVYTTQDVAGSINSGIYGINNLGQTAGYFVDAAGAHGYLEDGGTVTPLDVPGTDRTYAKGINDSGMIAGYFNFNLPTKNFNHGFVYSGGTYQQVDYPGALETEIFGINDAGQIVGYYFDDPNTFPNIFHGFVATPLSPQIPEPRALTLLLSGIAGIAIFQVIRRRPT